jgi:hypothetical protein
MSRRATQRPPTQGYTQPANPGFDPARLGEAVPSNIQFLHDVDPDQHSEGDCVRFVTVNKMVGKGICGAQPFGPTAWPPTFGNYVAPRPVAEFPVAVVAIQHGGGGAWLMSLTGGSSIRQA